MNVADKFEEVSVQANKLKLWIGGDGLITDSTLDYLRNGDDNEYNVDVAQLIHKLRDMNLRAAMISEYLGDIIEDLTEEL